MEAPTTRGPNRHHLPPITGAGPRGPGNERAHIPTLRTPAEGARQAVLHTGTHRATDGASSLSAASVPGSPAGPLPGGQDAADTQERGSAAHQRRKLGLGGRTPQGPPPQAGRDGTGPRKGHRPPDQLGPCATGLPTPAATQPHHRGAEDALQQRGHDAGNPGADEEWTGGSQPTAASRPMSPQQEPSTGNVPEEHLDTTPWHPSPTGTTPGQDRETMPPPPPRPPQRRNTDLFDEAQLRAVYDIHANTAPCRLVAALQGHLQYVNWSNFFAVVPLPHPASTAISVWQL